MPQKRKAVGRHIITDSPLMVKMTNMSNNQVLSTQNRRPKINTLRAVIGFALYLLFVPSLLFVSAGTMNWSMAWIYVVLLLISTIGSRLIVLKRYPKSLLERASFTEAEGAQSWDRPLAAIIGLFGPTAVMIVAGLDQRFSWSSVIPSFVQYLNVLAVAVGYGLAVWAMAVNPFFSAVARIQKDRGQFVVTSGPYRYVRHPSYAGALIASLALPIMLDAIWALVPALVIIFALILRTKREDRMLMEELNGYPAYSEDTPFLLIPGIW